MRKRYKSFKVKSERGRDIKTQLLTQKKSITMKVRQKINI